MTLIHFKVSLEKYYQKCSIFVTLYFQRMLYLQIREYIYQSRIYCPPEHAFLLASYALQERYGDHNVDLHKADQVAQFKLIPKR